MTQLQTRDTAQTTSVPVDPQGNGTKWTAIVVVGILALMAAAFGLAMWLDSGSETATQSEAQTSTVEPSSTEIVQAEIDAAQAALAAEPSSVEIVQAEIDAAQAALAAEPSSVEVVQAEIDEALAQIGAGRQSAQAEEQAAAEDEAAFGGQNSNPIPDWVGDRTVYWPGAHVNGVEASIAGPKALPEIPVDNYEPGGGLDAVFFGEGSFNPALTPAQIEQARAAEYVDYLEHQWINDLTPGQIQERRAEEYVEYLERIYVGSSLSSAQARQWTPDGFIGYQERMKVAT